MKKHQGETCTAYALFGAVIAALGGFLFGYHTAIVSGALIPLSQEFVLSLWDQSFLVSSVILGALGGASIAGFLADHLGRKMTLLMSAVVLLIGVVLTVYTPTYWIFIVSRLMSGVAIGMFSIVSPLYLAEIAPAPSRGAFVSSYQLAIVVGILAAYCVNLAYNEQGAWRMMFAIGLIPIVMQILGMLALSESPFFLLAQGKKEKASLVFTSLRKDKAWQSQVEEVKTASASRTRFSLFLFDPKLRFILILGLLISIFQQITGINTITFFTPKILAAVGNNAPMGVMITVWIGVANVVATLLSVFLMDRLGRRILMLTSVIGSVLSLCFLGWTLASPSACVLQMTFGALISYVSFFSLGLGPVTWVVISEIYPLAMRGKAMSIAIFANWVCSYLVTFSFLHLANWCGLSYSFYLYALIGVIIFLFMKKFLPETKGKTLEEIETALFSRRK